MQTKVFDWVDRTLTQIESKETVNVQLLEKVQKLRERAIKDYVSKPKEIRDNPNHELQTLETILNVCDYLLNGRTWIPGTDIREDSNPTH